MSSIVRQSKGLVSADIDGEVVMMSVEQGIYYRLDEVGSRIWGLIEQPMEVSVLCDRLLEEYEVERADCESGVLKFLDELLEQEGVDVDGAV
ncbi:lasso peptide biosynthesis PqqD family chaperone [Novosphingobium beihaiensis]|uniref:Lasso peptide biosynthesis PqqD family chaperone n=1 Tax=Novosphingobium beihaiensis TaxID=2930389 RepID=A0ABT0BPT4_9SPHN|nr:lasso peptide biosynthesis PqqD family chaperone [Novosphingobium beihaiensis]MCJ2187067.1 lasso peptide biosynthesis PqqD family chaperone [Novosphingobium beihaiensis]